MPVGNSKLWTEFFFVVLALAYSRLNYLAEQNQVNIAASDCMSYPFGRCLFIHARHLFIRFHFGRDK